MKRQVDKLKFHIETLKRIAGIEKRNMGTVLKTGSSINAITGTFKPEKNKFNLDFSIDIFDRLRGKIQVGGRYKRVNFQTKKENLILEELFIHTYSISQYSASTSKFYTKGFSKKIKYYYRFIVPIKKELKFHYYIEHTSFSTDVGYRSTLCSEVKFDNKRIEIYSLKYKEENYAVIDVDSKMVYESFSQIVFALLVSYGYISGFMPGDKGYYIAYTRNKMDNPAHLYFTTLRETTESFYTPIHSNSFGYIRQKRKQAQKFYSKLKPLSLNEFSKLFELTHNSLSFSSVLLLIIESSIASLLFMPGGYAIALETLSDIIMTEKKIDLAPITDKALRKKIIKECQEVITSNGSGTLSKDALELLKSRITSNLNKPTNKAQLKAPFDMLGIKLLDEDLKLLNTRNDFLHGRSPDITNLGGNRSLERLNAEIFYCSIRFYTLLNLLILKWVGYDNYVLNHPKIQERATMVKLRRELPFRKI